MSVTASTILKTTGEKVIVIAKSQNIKTGADMLTVILPAQAPWHNPRVQTVKADKIHRVD